MWAGTGQNILDLITDALVNERLDDIVLQDSEYQKSMDEVDALAKKLKKLNLSVEETKAVNRLICGFLTQNALYSKAAYQQGFTDCANLLQEIGLV